METYARSVFEAAGITGEFVQQNHSRSVQHVLRGLHFQKEPYAQSKLVRCTKGEIMDVAVDIRPRSMTFRKYFSLVLSETNKTMLYIPRGFAHGFLTLSEVAEVQYAVDNGYAPNCEQGIIWNDPELAINWPNGRPLLSERDKKWPTLSGLDLSESPS